MKRGLTAAMILVLAAGLAWFAWGPRAAAPSSGSDATGAAPQAAPSPLSMKPLAPWPAIPAEPMTAEDQAFANGLRERFAGVIAGKHAQIKLLEQVLAYLQARYPEDWRERLPGMLRALFPDLAEALYEQAQRLLGFNDWLRTQRAALMGLSPEQRREALWAARLAAFGADAEVIWAAERRQERVAVTLAQLDRDTGLTATEKMGVYLGEIRQTYGERAPDLLARRQTEVINRFLDLESVQNELQALPEAQRNATLSELRQQVGMDGPALARWGELDQARDRQWQGGREYMQERARILSESPAAEQGAQLDALRERRFGVEEAAILNAEEAAGFYRFGRPRRYGRE